MLYMGFVKKCLQVTRISGEHACFLLEMYASALKNQ